MWEVEEPLGFGLTARFSMKLNIPFLQKKRKKEERLVFTRSQNY